MSGPKSYELSEKELRSIAKRAMDQRMRILEKNKNKLLEDFNKGMNVFNNFRKEIDLISEKSNEDLQNSILKLKENLNNQVLKFTESKKYNKDILENNTPVINDIENIKNDYETARDEYISACIFAEKEVPDCFQFDLERAEEFTIFLKHESQRIMNEAMNEIINREAYQASMETLNEMCYTVIGENNLNGIHSTLLRVKDNIGVNILTSTDENGVSRYTYEIVGITDDGHSVTDEERETILKSMSELCLSDFTKFIEMLHQKGFEVRNLIDRQPNAKYCKNKCVLDYVDSEKKENSADNCGQIAASARSFNKNL